MDYFSKVLFLNIREAELIQYLKPVGCGPSVNTCPKCALQLLQTTSTLNIPCVLSLIFSMLLLAIGVKKLGHPDPDLNFELESNKGDSQQIHLYSPSS